MRPYKPKPQRERLINGATSEEQLARMARRRNGIAVYNDYLNGKTRTPPLFLPWDPTEAFDELDSRHGTLSAYTSGCRCPWCRHAGRAFREAQKAGTRLPKGWNAKEPGAF